METTRCINCNAALTGPYCSSCGEKKVGNKDFTIKHLLEQGVDVFTHLDSKLFKSAKALFIQPGLLPLEYVNGRRKPYMKPFQVFFLCNILFFVLLSHYDLLMIPSQWFFMDGAYAKLSITKIAHATAERKHISMESLALLYDAKVASLSKLLVIVMVPLLALVCWLVGFRKHPQYGKNFIFALLLVAGYLMIDIVWAMIAKFLPVNVPPLVFNGGMSSFYLVYTFFAWKRFYRHRVWFSLISAVIVAATFMAMSLLYREAVSVMTLKLM